MTTISDDQGFIRIPENKYCDANIVRSYLGRQIDLEKPIKVYRNLRLKCYSILQGDKVVAHADRLMIADASFIVNENRRQKVIKTKRKNVHAFIKGYYKTSGMGSGADGKMPAKITYNPYEGPFFMCKNLVKKPFAVIGATTVICSDEVTAAHIH